VHSLLTHSLLVCLKIVFPEIIHYEKGGYIDIRMRDVLGNHHHVNTLLLQRDRKLINLYFQDLAEFTSKALTSLLAATPSIKFRRQLRVISNEVGGAP